MKMYIGIKKLDNLLIVAISLFMLTSCGGGGGGSNGGNPPETVYGTAWIATTLEDVATRGEGDRLTRWDETIDLIPVKHNSNTFAIAAMDEIESRIGRLLFDRTSLTGVATSAITVGIIVSENTANWYVTNGGVTEPRLDDWTCGLVSKGIEEASGPDDEDYFVDFGSGTGYTDVTIRTKLFIHLGSPIPGACTVTNDIAIHEFGHALGLSEGSVHFEGFGIGSVISQNFWNVLKNLYNNNPNSDVNLATITQYYF